MRTALLLVSLVSLAGCDGASVEAEPGQFQATLSGAFAAELAGEATFAFANCAFISLRSGDRLLSFNDFCVTSEGQIGPRRGRFTISPEWQGGYAATFRDTPTSTTYRGVSGEIEILNREQTRVSGRFRIEAKPLDEDAEVIEEAESLILSGEFNAEGREALD
jgi:hypothetical protein